MDPLVEQFEERLQEIETYLDLLDALERQVREGPPKIGGENITSQQQKILYSAVYLQLYNLVEATATWCVEAVCEAAAGGNRWLPGDLTVKIRREWVRDQAKTHTDLNYENRLAKAVATWDHLVNALPIDEWGIERTTGGGSWDDQEIEKITDRLGCNLYIDPVVRTGIKRPIRDDKAPLELVKDLKQDWHMEACLSQNAEKVQLWAISDP